MNLRDQDQSISGYPPSAIPADRQSHRQTDAIPPTQQIEAWHVWDVLRRRSWLMLAILVAIAVSGVVYTNHQRPVYSATALMMFPSGRNVTTQADDLRLLGDLASMAKSRSVAGVLQVLESPDMMRSAAARLKPEELDMGFGHGKSRGNGLPKWALSFDSTKDSDVIAVTADAYNPHVAANLANLAVSAYIERDQEYSERASRLGRERLASELKSIRRQLSAAQRELSAFKRSTRLVGAEDQLQQMVGGLVALQSEQDKADVELAASRRQAETLHAQLKAQGSEIDESRTIETSPQYQEALSDLDKLNAKRANLIQEYTPTSEEVKSVDGEIAEAEQHIKKIAQTLVAAKVQTQNPMVATYAGSVVGNAAAEAKTRALKRVIAERNKQMEQLPDQDRVYTDLERRVRVLDGTYQTLSSKYYALLVNEKSTVPTALLAAKAQPPSSPSHPNKQKNILLFLLLGILLALAAAAIAERFDKRIRYEDTITELTGDAPLTVIPYVKPLNGSALQLDSLDTNSPFVESFRVLRNIIRFSSAKPIKTLAVTSPSSAEGKSTASVGLAAAMAMAGQKVLVVDCDLRRPLLHTQTQNPGFTSVVQGLISLEEAICPTAVENLFCLPCGPIPANPAEFLDLPESRRLLKALTKNYDILILDCPPCSGLSDTQVISTIVDGIVLVVAANQTLYPRLVDALRALEQVNAPFVGCVINRSNLSRGRYHYYGRGDDSGGDGHSEIRKLSRRGKVMSDE